MMPATNGRSFHGVEYDSMKDDPATAVDEAHMLRPTTIAMSGCTATTPRGVRPVQSECRLRPRHRREWPATTFMEQEMISMTILDAMPFRASLDAARSATQRGSIGIGHLERCAAKVLDIVDLATGHQLQADRVDHQGHAVGRGDRVSLFRFP